MDQVQAFLPYAPLVVVMIVYGIYLCFGRHRVVMSALLGASYVALTAIIAVPSFRGGSVDIAKQQEELDKALTLELAGGYPTVPPMGDRAQRTESILNRVVVIGPLDSQPPPIPGIVAKARNYITEKALELQRADRWTSRNTDQSVKSLIDQHKVAIEQNFVEQNRGRIGPALTDRHRDQQVSNFHATLVQLKSTYDVCQLTLDNQYTDLENEAKLLADTSKLAENGNVNLQSYVGMLDIDAAAAPWAARTNDAMKWFWANCGLPDALQIADRERPAIATQLQFFGRAANWLLETESQELALITGMIGFGLLGAIGASFIRAEPGSAVSPDLVPIFVRGITAAFLVFLAVMSGISVFTTTGEPQPNAYALFFTCFVAAVYSEDVWAWAKLTQEQRLKRAAEREKAQAEAATDKATADKAAADNKATADKATADKATADMAAADKAAGDKAAGDKAAADKVAADKVAADKGKAAVDKAAAD